MAYFYFLPHLSLSFIIFASNNAEDIREFVNSWLILRMASSTVFWHRLSCELVWWVLQLYLSALLLIGCLFCTLSAVWNYPIADVRNLCYVLLQTLENCIRNTWQCSKQCLVTVLRGESVCFIHIYICRCMCVFWGGGTLVEDCNCRLSLHRLHCWNHGGRLSNHRQRLTTYHVWDSCQVRPHVWNMALNSVREDLTWSRSLLSLCFSLTRK